MGTWGPGNFENDGACDYRDQLLYQLIDKIEECFQSEDGYALDEGGESELMPSIEILALLCEYCNAHPPKEETVTSWKERYLTLYDEDIESLAPDPRYRAARRKVIEVTFQRLELQARLFWFYTERNKGSTRQS